ncbi:MAG: peptide ABC transporter substrate-binding protein [Pseudomonadota bacterium]
MTRIDRRALFASGAAAALLAATGVSAAPQRGGRLRAALSPELFDMAVRATVHDTLTEIAADGTLRAALATDWTADDSARCWDLTLREGVILHDGTTFGASALDLPFEIEVTGPNRVAVHLRAPDASLPFRLASPEYSVALAGLYAAQKLDEGRHFIGTRVKDHWRTDAGWFDSVEYVQFSDPNVRAEALRDGYVDVADVADLGPQANTRDFQPLPTGHVPLQIASRAVAVPLTVGKAWPLDNLRMAERWWMA